MSKNNTFKRGDLVEHLTGGPTMVVSSVTNAGDDRVHTRWFNETNHNFVSQSFAVEELRPFDPEKSPS